MGEPERSNPQTPNSKKHSIDDIIDHMTADLQSYDGQYILLGSPPNPQHIWSEYPASQAHPMTVHSPVFVQHTYDMQERQTPPGMFYPNANRIREGSGEMIGMMDVGGGNFVNVVFNPANPGNQIHPFIPTHPPDPNLGFIHYQQQQHLQQQQPQPSAPNLPSVQRDYGLFSSTANEATSPNNQQLIDNVVGNWLPNKSGTYSPFGNVNSQMETKDEPISVRPGQPSQSKKQRIVAEVRPMRPSYSDVLAKSIPPLTPPLPSAKSPPPTNTSSKSEGRKQNAKGVKGGSNTSKTLNLSSLKRQLSNSSEEQSKASVKRWISLDDLTPPQSSEENSFNDFELYLDENVGNSSDNTQPATGEGRKEKKQKKKSRPTGDSQLSGLMWQEGQSDTKKAR